MRAIRLSDGTVFTHPKAIGAYGEKLVASLLPGVININAESDKKLPYDLVWQGIEIDVKFTTQLANTNRVAYHPKSWSDRVGCLMVMVALIEDVYYFWLRKYGYPGASYLYLETAFEAHELPNKILDYVK